MTANTYGVGGDDLGSEFWRLLETYGFHLQQCQACGNHRFPPNYLCPFCHSLAYEWVAVSGAGTVYSQTLVHRAPNDEWATRAPYYLIIAELAEGPLVLAHLQASPDSSVEIGDMVNLVVVLETSGRSIYEFRLVREPVAP